MAYRAAIVEDEEEVRKYLTSKLAEQFSFKNTQVEFDPFTNGDEFFRIFEKHHYYDLIFMDIEMPGTSGIDICRKVRSISPEALLIFISNRDELVFQSIEVQPFRFVRKSHFDEQLPLLVDAIVNELAARQPHLIRIKENGTGDILVFDIHQILYVEARGRLCRVVTNQNSVLVKTKFSMLEKMLLTEEFLKPHRSYLVNCHYIFRLEKDQLILTNNAVIPISRNRSEEVRNQFLDYASEGLS